MALSPIEAVDEIQRLMMHLASGAWDQTTLPKLLELLEEGEDWVANMREFLGAE